MTLETDKEILEVEQELEQEEELEEELEQAENTDVSGELNMMCSS